MSGRRGIAGTADLLIIGAGLAGLAAAYTAAARGARVVLVTLGPRAPGASSFAQGGIAVPRGLCDVPAHVRDTVEAGRGICEQRAVESIVGEAIEVFRWLRRRGARFDRGYGREGGHSLARIRHRGGDRTGAHTVSALAAAVAALRRPPIVLAGQRAVSLCRHGRTVTGALLRSGRGELRQFQAGAVLLATGGLGRLYARSTNPPGACGEGLALAFLAGAVIRDVEFVQFHPTVLPDGVLVTEAVRGAGARLLNGRGEYFMERYASAADLAPRDVVARAVWREAALHGPVGLDLRGVRGLPERFPGLFQHLDSRGYRPLTEPIPVAPAAHYSVGGIKTELDGRTSVVGLYAAGEVASTGLHGANRLASNSMLEALVMGRRAAGAALDHLGSVSQAGKPLPMTAIGERIAWLPRAMLRHAGLLRDGASLRALDRRLARLCREAVPAQCSTVSALRILTARLIVHGALWREERCGVHWRSDSVRRGSPAYHLDQTLIRGAAACGAARIRCKKVAIEGTLRRPRESC